MGNIGEQIQLALFDTSRPVQICEHIGPPPRGQLPHLCLLHPAAGVMCEACLTTNHVADDHTPADHVQPCQASMPSSNANDPRPLVCTRTTQPGSTTTGGNKGTVFSLDSIQVAYILRHQDFVMTTEGIYSGTTIIDFAKFYCPAHLEAVKQLQRLNHPAN